MKKINKRNIIAAYARWLYITKAWRTDKKIVVIESDDWGAIRTSNKESYKKLSKMGYAMEKSPYTLDAIESNDDLSALYEVLDSIKDREGNPACFTANMIMANPDFYAIERNNFSEYIYESVDITLERYKGREMVRSLWKDGMKLKMFFPQLHAREHVRYWDWINDLKVGEKEAIDTFKLKMCGVPKVVSKKGRSYYHPPYIDDAILFEEGIDQNDLISESARLFNEEFGFDSKSVIAPNCGWTASSERVWNQNNIKYIQGGFLQEHHNSKGIKYIPHYLGERSKQTGQIYLVRNCTFEPSTSANNDYWRSTLKQVERAFNLKTPAIISSHRVNYVGSIKKENRVHGLNQLEQLLISIKHKWPKVIFINSAQLGNLIIKK